MSAAAKSRLTGSEAILADLVDQIVATLQAGGNVDLAGYVAQYPDLAEPLQKLLPSLEVLAELGSRTGASGGDSALAPGAVSGAPPLGTLGDFRIRRELGRGGMGVVYEAEQVSLGRRVAVKVLPFAANLDAKQLQRFQNEARAAAHLHHTNIVPVYSIGAERGVHFYAMQYIAGRSLADVIAELRGERRPADGTAEYREGQPADTAAAKQATTHSSLGSDQFGTNTFVTAALELGIQAADALDHAHQLGVVHRDVKPANLLLDADRRLWVADFGLAQFRDGTNLTLTGDLVGTLRYMSPEQALAKRVVIDHRTDIYSLGVTLYELLTLEPAMTGKDRQEILRQIAFEEPRAPRKIRKTIPAEVETIVLKMMEKDPSSRYATAKEAADDLRRFLLHEPIKARRPGIVLRTRKWARRHPAVIGSAMIMLVLTVIGLAVSNVLIGQERDAKDAALHAKGIALEEKDNALRDKEAALVRETEEKEAARRSSKLAIAVTEFLAIDLLEEASPQRNPRDKKVTVEEALDRAAARIPGRFKDEPFVEVNIRRYIGRAYHALGAYASARIHLERALELCRQHPDIKESALFLVLSDLAVLYFDQCEYAKAAPLLQEALALSRLQGSERPDTLMSLNGLALILAKQEQFAEAEAILVKVVAVAKRMLGPDNPDTLEAMNSLAWCYWEQDKFDEAAPLFEQALDGRRRVLRDDHPYTLKTMQNLAMAYLGQRQFAKAEPLLIRALEGVRKVAGSANPDAIMTMNNLARLYFEQGQLTKAEPLYAQALELGRRVLGAQHEMTLFIQSNLGEVYAQQKQHAKAEPLFRDAVKQSRNLVVQVHHPLDTALAILGNNLLQQKRYADAEPLLHECVAIRQEKAPADFHLFIAKSMLGASLLGQKKYAEAEPLLLAGYEGIQERQAKIAPPARQQRLTEALERLVQLYERTGKQDAAERWRKKLDATRNQVEKK